MTGEIVKQSFMDLKLGLSAVAAAGSRLESSLKEHVSPEDNLSNLQLLVTDWAKEAFPDRNVHTVVHKLLTEEMPELAVSLGKKHLDNIADEFADVMILFLDIWELYEIDINRAIRIKMSINRVRTWTVDADGISRHVDPAKADDHNYADPSAT